MLYRIWDFLKYPVYPEEEKAVPKKASTFFKLLALTVACSIVMGILIEIITQSIGFNLDDHAMMELMDTYPPMIIFVLVAVLAPLLEELLFRAPLGLFRKSNYFKFAFYASVILFGLMHMTNFNTFDDKFWLIPLLVSPQLSAGIFLGYTRVKFGLLWSILLHAGHNLVLLGPFILIRLLDIPFE